jgi:hypothetical protein
MYIPASSCGTPVDVRTCPLIHGRVPGVVVDSTGREEDFGRRTNDPTEVTTGALDGLGLDEDGLDGCTTFFILTNDIWTYNKNM